MVVLNHSSVENADGTVADAPDDTRPAVEPSKAEAEVPVVPATAPGVWLWTPLPKTGVLPPAQSDWMAPRG